MAHVIREGTKADIDILVDMIQNAFLDVAERFGLTLQNSRHILPIAAPNGCCGK